MLEKSHHLIKKLRLNHFKTWGILSLLFLFGCQQKTHLIPDIETKVMDSERQDIVILLHGMWRDSRAMAPVEAYLTSKGYQVLNLSYPSTKFSVPTLVTEHLHPIIENIHPQPGQKIHLVTHSMGGILVRYYLKHFEIQSLGRVVMMSPPNQGSELADFVDNSDWIMDSVGPSGLDLSTEENSLVKNLGPVDFDLGVIAGNYNPNWITSTLLPGPDDGVVSVESMKVTGMNDLILVSERHYRLRGLKKVHQQIAYYLENGKFYHTPPKEV